MIKKINKATVVTILLAVAVMTGTAVADPNPENLKPQIGAITNSAIISNGLIQMGINDQGHLNIYGGTPSSGSRTPYVGLRFLPTNAEVAAPACLCEGWGAADNISKISGSANIDRGGVINMALVSFTNDSATATSIVNISNKLQVRHFYHPSATPNLYQVDISITNIGSAPVELLYRRVIDWDVEPTAFDEFVTVETGTAANISFTSNNGFASADPLSGRTDIGFTGSFTDVGPLDQGALFDLNFGMLAPGATRDFRMFYGAAATEAEAIAAVLTVGAEAFSFGQPNTPDGPTLGDPNTFILAFADIGGAPVHFAAPPVVDLQIAKFEDLNGNGKQDTGEPRLPDWNFTVNDKNNINICTGSTDANGTLSCPAIDTSLNPPPYTVTEDLKPGWINTKSNPIRIFPLFTPVTISFGNIRFAEIHGMKWDDRNGNGTKEATERGIENITICSRKSFGAEVCTKTDSTGNYSFTNLTPGYYEIYEILPAGKIQTFPKGSYRVTLNSSEIKGGFNFGNQNASRIYGYKFNDTNGNRTQEAGEEGVAGVEIRLTLLLPTDKSFRATTYTNTTGNYSFDMVPYYGTNTYYQVEEFPYGTSQTLPADGKPYTNVLINRAGANVGSLVFGNQPVPPGEIRGMKFNDSNASGVQDAGELGIPGVTICIKPMERCTTTNTTGYYRFTDVPTGTYTVYEQLFSNRVATTPGTVTVTVNSTEVKTVNFGNRMLVPPLSDVSIAQQFGTQNGIPTVLRPGLTNLTIRKNLTNVSGTILAVNLTLEWNDGTTKTTTMTEINGTKIWEATIYPPWPSGAAHMTFNVDVAEPDPDAVQIGDILFIDPSGQIQNACTGAPISDASVTLLREYPPDTDNFIISETGHKPFPYQIPDINPLTTGADGYYNWVVPPGKYKVMAEMTGYTTAESPSMTVVLEPVTNLNVSLTPVEGCPIKVAIDIKPGGFPNSINLGSNGTVPVAILSTSTFDATTVDPLTVTLASAPVKLKGKGTPMASKQDINGDGLLDLVVQVSTDALALSSGDTEAALEGKTYSGKSIIGSDSVRIVPP